MRRAYSGLSLLLGSEPFAGTEGRLVSGGESVCGDGVVVDRASVGGGCQRREMVLALPPGCLMVTMVARAPLRGSGASIGVVSAGYSRGADGGFVWAQPLGLGPQSSPAS